MQAWFAHFYALGAAWNAVVAWALLRSGYLASLPAPTAASAALALALLQLHLTRRLVETVGLLHYPPGSRMHGIAYLFGMRWGRVPRVWCKCREGREEAQAVCSRSAHASQAPPGLPPAPPATQLLFSGVAVGAA